jgi:outer membrane protein
MSGVKKTQIILVLLAVMLAALVFIAPKTLLHPKKIDVPVTSNSVSFSFEHYRDSTYKTLSVQDAKRADSLISVAGDKKLNLFDSIAVIYDHSGNPASAAYYFEQKAELDQTEQSYVETAFRYKKSFKNSRSQDEASFFIGKAIANYQKVLEINPHNLNAKTDLGVSLTEGTGQPMQGIKLLREVVEEDPENEYAQESLGYLSMKSGQYEKAIARFTKVVEINPARLDMYVYLGESYAQLEDFDNAIINLQIFANLSNDRMLVEDVNKYIERLKSDRLKASVGN